MSSSKAFRRLGEANVAKMLASVVSLSVLGGCSYDELQYITQRNITGTVKIPVEAATLTLLEEDEDGNSITRTISDPRVLGPVYIGAFPSVEYGHFDYMHPEMGPVITDGYPGDTYPYGGTTVGRFGWGCYESLVCKLVTGRYETYDEIIDFFGDTENGIGQPVTDAVGNEVTDGTVMQEHCFEIEYYTADFEVDAVNHGVDFELDGDYYVADVEISHSHFVDGMAVWGWVDMPSTAFAFATCDDGIGEVYQRYADSFYIGSNHPDLLNFPSRYIDEGDYVNDEATIVEADENGEPKSFEITLGYKYEG